MQKNFSRPVFQGVLKYRYPVTAIASVLHRISGVIIFLLIPALLCFLQKSLVSQEDFQALKILLNKPLSIITLWVILIALIYHLVAGIRHLIMDSGHAESLKAGKLSAWIVFAFTVVLLFLIGIFI